MSIKTLGSVGYGQGSSPSFADQTLTGDLTIGGDIVFGTGPRNITAQEDLQIGTDDSLNTIRFNEAAGQIEISAPTTFDMTIAGGTGLIDSTSFNYTTAGNSTFNLADTGDINIAASDFATYGGRFYCTAAGDIQVYGVTSAELQGGGQNIVINATKADSSVRVDAPSFSIGDVDVLTGQGVAVADATGLGDIVTQFNALLASVRTIDVIAT